MHQNPINIKKPNSIATRIQLKIKPKKPIANKKEVKNPKLV
jgi:phosphotransferase system IIB component